MTCDRIEEIIDILYRQGAPLPCLILLQKSARVYTCWETDGDDKKRSELIKEYKSYLLQNPKYPKHMQYAFDTLPQVHSSGCMFQIDMHRMQLEVVQSANQTKAVELIQKFSKKHEIQDIVIYIQKTTNNLYVSLENLNLDKQKTKKAKLTQSKPESPRARTKQK